MNHLLYYRFALQSSTQIRATHSVADFPKILNLLQKYLGRYTHDVGPVLQEASVIPVVIANGILADQQGEVYSMFVNSAEDASNILLTNESGQQEKFFVDLGPGGCVIILSDHRLDEPAFLNTLLIHELSHFVQNKFDGEKPVDNYLKDPDENEARSLEMDTLQVSEKMDANQAKEFLEDKYFPK